MECWLWTNMFPHRQVGEQNRGIMETILSASEVKVEAFAEAYEAGGRAVDVGEVVDGVRIWILHYYPLYFGYISQMRQMLPAPVKKVDIVGSWLSPQPVIFCLYFLLHYAQLYEDLLSPCLSFGLSTEYVFLCCASTGRYEYSLNFRDTQSSDGSTQGSREFGTNMVYYYDDGSKVQMYTVDEKLLKEYIKRQM